MRRHHLLKSGPGQALILMALAMPLFFALAGVVVDGSMLMAKKRQFQNIADAVALATSAKLPTDGSSCDTTPGCPAAVQAAATHYYTENGGTDSIGPCDPADPHQQGTSCYLTPYKGQGTKIEVWISEPVSGFFTSVAGLGKTFTPSARAVGSALAAVSPPGTLTQTITGTTQTVETPNGESTTTIVSGGTPTAIFARAQICSAFFIPGSYVHVSGVSTFGGIGNIKDGTDFVDAIRMNYDFFPGQSENCSYAGSNSSTVPPAANVPFPPEFWCYDASHNPCGGTGPDEWPVPFPDRAALFRSNDAHCLYTNAPVSQKQLQSGLATITMAQADCLKTGDSVTIAGVDTVFNGTYTITGTPSANSFTFAKSRAPFTRTVSKKAMDGGVATLTTTAAHGLVVGDIVNISGVSVTGGIDFNGGPFVVTAVPSTTTFSYETDQTQNLAVTTKALASGVATLTTAVQHHLSVGDDVVVNINDSRFDGTYQVTAVPSNTTFRYTPAPVSPADVTGNEISSGIAKLTTSANHNLNVGDTVTVAVGDPRFDGTFAVTSVPSSTVFTYNAPVIAVKSYSVTSNVATLTATTPPHGLQVGDSVTVNFTGAGAPTYLNGTFTLTAVTSSTFSYAVTHANVTTTNKNTNVTITTVDPAGASGTATLTSIASAPATGTVTVGPFLAAVASGGTVSATGDVAPTTTAGTVTSGSTANQTVGTGWTATHAPGIYIVDAGYGVGLTISASNTIFDGYTFVAPEILVSGSNNTFTKFSGAAQDALFYAYNPNGDAVHVNGTTTGNILNGSMFCGPPVRTGATDPTNKCWFGGTGTTFNGLMEAWHIEYTANNATFNGSGPPIGPGTTTTVATTTLYGTTVVTTPDVTTTVTTPGVTTGTTPGLDE
jgi:Flp pilus assembly protein TadG